MTTQRLRRGGLAAWAIGHPVAVIMLALSTVVTGGFAADRLSIDLLPEITYPEVRVRILDPGVPARVMEDRITRFLEEQLAITEDAVHIQSRTSEGGVSVDLAFEYGKDIDVALRDASNRLDRAQRFLPTTIDPPIIFKLDPHQIPVAEYVVGSPLRDPVVLRDWVDDELAPWFITLPGVASVEAGGGLEREIQVLPDPGRLAALGLTPQDLANAIQRANRDEAGGRLTMARQEFTGRTEGRLTDAQAFRNLAIPIPNGDTLPLSELAEVRDTHADERIRARLDGVPGIQFSIQKQPEANTVSVVNRVDGRLAWLHEQNLIPADTVIQKVSDQADYVRASLTNAQLAALSGALLAMLVVYLFLGDLRRTLIIGTAIPLALTVTVVLMAMSGLSLNLMTLGGLALGVGMLVDSTIVMMENIQRHQRRGESAVEAGPRAAGEVNSAIVAATATNLAAVVPFLFVGGLIGLLFRELIVTISAAILASMVVALTLVPALAARVANTEGGLLRRGIDRIIGALANTYSRLLHGLLRRWWLILGIILLFVGGLAAALHHLAAERQIFLPSMDDGRVNVTIVADPGIALDEMDRAAARIEALMAETPQVDNIYSIVGGRVFGRTTRETPNNTSMTVTLVPHAQRDISAEEWVERMDGKLAEQGLAGIDVRMQTGGVRGIRMGRGEDDISLLLQGPDLEILSRLGDEMVAELRGVEQIRNVRHSAEELRQELGLRVDRDRAATLGLSVEEVADTLRLALDGRIISDFIEGDRTYDVRMRLPRDAATSPGALRQLLVFGGRGGPHALGDLAEIEVVPTPAEILRDNQRRAIEVTATLAPGAAVDRAQQAVQARLDHIPLPTGYSLYEAGIAEALQEGQQTAAIILALALFLVIVVMAIQYESIRNPFIILLGVPFAITGVSLGLYLTGLPLSMPVWLGVIMLAGIVVNNAIVFVEFIEIQRDSGRLRLDAIVEAARLRLRPILMTTLTTAMGLLPLALALGQGAEMLQPLAVTIISGLSFSLLVSLFLIPTIYSLIGRRDRRGADGPDMATA